MLVIKQTKQFKKDFDKRLLTNKLVEVLYHLVNAQELPKRYQDHKLIGNFVGFRECHINPDLLLIYRVCDNNLELYALNSHSNLFK